MKEYIYVPFALYNNIHFVCIYVYICTTDMHVLNIFDSVKVVSNSNILIAWMIALLILYPIITWHAMWNVPMNVIFIYLYYFILHSSNFLVVYVLFSFSLLVFLAMCWLLSLIYWTFPEQLSVCYRGLVAEK